LKWCTTALHTSKKGNPWGVVLQPGKEAEKNLTTERERRKVKGGDHWE